MPRVLRRPLAETDIFEIWDYIADDGLAAADRWVDRIDEQFSLLAAQPLIGRSRDELAPGMRSFAVGLAGTLFSMCHFPTGSMWSVCCTVRETSKRSSIQSNEWVVELWFCFSQLVQHTRRSWEYCGSAGRPRLAPVPATAEVADRFPTEPDLLRRKAEAASARWMAQTSIGKSDT